MSTEDGRQRSRAGLCTRLPLPAGAKGDAMADETGLEERERERWLAGWLWKKRRFVDFIHSSRLCLSRARLSLTGILFHSLCCVYCPSVCLEASPFLSFTPLTSTHYSPRLRMRRGSYTTTTAIQP